MSATDIVWLTVVFLVFGQYSLKDFGLKGFVDNKKNSRSLDLSECMQTGWQVTLPRFSKYLRFVFI